MYLDEELYLTWNNIYLTEGMHLYSLYLDDANADNPTNLIFEGSIYITSTGAQDVSIYVSDLLNDYRYINALDNTNDIVDNYRVNVTAILSEDDDNTYTSTLNNLRMYYRYPNLKKALEVDNGVMIQGYGSNDYLVPKIPYKDNYTIQPLYSDYSLSTGNYTYDIICGSNTSTSITTTNSSIQMNANVGELTEEPVVENIMPENWNIYNTNMEIIVDSVVQFTKHVEVFSTADRLDERIDIYLYYGEGIDNVLYESASMGELKEFTIPATYNGSTYKGIIVSAPNYDYNYVSIKLDTDENPIGDYSFSVLSFSNEEYYPTYTLILSGVYRHLGYANDVYVRKRLGSTTGSKYKVATIDFDCISKYYMKWVDRAGSFQSQPMNAFVKYSESVDTQKIQSYSGRNRKTNFQVTPKYTINTGWVEEKYVPYYESIFVSPYLKLYDTEEEVEYDVILTDKNYTEEKYEYGRKLINLVFNVEVTRKQNMFA